GETFSHRCGEVLDDGPLVVPDKGSDDVDALAACEQWKTLESQGIKYVAHVESRGLDLREADVLSWVEVKHQSVRSFDIVDTRTPDVEFEHTHLRRCYQALLVFEIKIVLVRSILLLYRQRPEAVLEAGTAM